MTPQAREAILAADRVVGYLTYLDLIKDLIEGKETVGTAMMQEVDRCQQAVDLAVEGHQVVVVSSGDSGVYGMAGLVLELANKVPAEKRPSVDIVPGLSAVNVAASVLGAPLMHDFAVISLSDLMTPWDLIKKRADLCAQGDMVISLYNPRSKKRVTHLDEVREIVLKYRDPKTPVGIVQKAGRPGQHMVISDLENFTKIVADKAKEHKFTIMMGRTHGVHAEPTTFGLKLATWYSEMKRNIERFEHAAAGVEAGKISGAVGNFANIPPFVEKYVCDKLGIRAQEISTQVLPRDLHAEYFAVLASIATSIERMATEIRGLQKSEQREVEEFFAKGQKGSSAMPHKRNPIGSENMTGLARVIRGHMVTAYENVSLWHERDISHSSAERIITPDTTILIDYMLNRFGNIVKNLTVFPENMKRNMNSTFGLIFSQRAMLTLIEKGMTREQAYDLVQPKTAQSWDNQVDFKPLLEADPEVTSRLTQEEIDEIFNPTYYTKRVDEIFERIGLGD
ncbi:adenylosuccinate lyase [Veillonella sp.]